jgi:hypothetical protein
MTFTVFWVLCGIIAAAELGFVVWWDKIRPISLADLLIGIFLVVCPFVDTYVVFWLTLYIVFEVFPKVVLFGPKK